VPKGARPFQLRPHSLTHSAARRESRLPRSSLDSGAARPRVPALRAPRGIGCDAAVPRSGAVVGMVVRRTIFAGPRPDVPCKGEGERSTGMSQRNWRWPGGGDGLKNWMTACVSETLLTNGIGSSATRNATMKAITQTSSRRRSSGRRSAGTMPVTVAGVARSLVISMLRSARDTQSHRRTDRRLSCVTGALSVARGTRTERQARTSRTSAPRPSPG
jgi:hypothetical protein